MKPQTALLALSGGAVVVVLAALALRDNGTPLEPASRSEKPEAMLVVPPPQVASLATQIRSSEPNRPDTAPALFSQREVYAEVIRLRNLKREGSFAGAFMLQDSCLMVMQDLALLDRSALSAAGPAMDAMRMQATQEVRRRCENVPAQLALREPLPDDRSGKAFLQAFEKLYSTTAFNTRALQSLAAQGALWTTASFLTSRDGVYFGGQEYGGLAQSEFIQATLLAELWSHPGSGGDSDTRLLALCATRNGCSEDPQTAIALAYNGGASLSPETLALAKRIHQAFQSNDVGAFLRPKPSDAAERRPLP